MTSLRVWIVIVFAPGLLAVPSVYAQGTEKGDARLAARWEPPGLDMSSNGGWRVKARRVAAARARLIGQRNFAVLNAQAPVGASATVVTGTLRVPAILFRYQDSPPAQYGRSAAEYDATLFGAVPPNGKPYTLRSFYEEMSNGLFSLQGQSVGWVALSGNEASYTGGQNCLGLNPYGLSNCNGVWSFAASIAMQAGLREALTHADSTVDFAQFDNDGPDEIPNSGDDDGVVDAVLFLHASMEGSCTSSNNNHLWAHHWVLGATTTYTTNDNRTGGGKIVADEYILQSGLGSPTGGVCDSTAIAPIGSAAHELGHVLALPDLYNTQTVTPGVGNWSLMASGDKTKPLSPSRLDAWSLQQMGWATIAPITTSGTYSVGPEPTADTVFFVDVQPPNPRPEHFLIENRQAVQSDSAMIRLLGGGGLMIWHIDDAKACLLDYCFPHNTVNTGSIHGVKLEEADGLRQLWCESDCNRGDGGDPYPGTSSNTVFSVTTNPAATKNLDTSFVGFAVDSIQQLVPNGPMSFRLRFGGLTTVQASDTTVPVVVDADSFHVFSDLLDDGSNHTIAVPDTVTLSRTRYSFVSWSDGGAAAHGITGALAGATYTATVARAHRLDVVVGANGTVAFNPPADSSGVYVTENTAVTLTATPTAPAVFGGWTGDTASANLMLTLPMSRPYLVSAHFDPQLAITSGDPRPAGIMAKPYADTLRATGGGGTFNWQLVGGALPSGLSLGISGRITGIPLDTGSFSFTARVTSGAQQAVQTYGLTITAPTLAQASVLAQLLNASGALTTDEIRYLDQIGNKSCLPAAINATCFDVGDFLAWVQLTGATPTPTPPPAAVVGNGGRP